MCYQAVYTSSPIFTLNISLFQLMGLKLRDNNFITSVLPALSINAGLAVYSSYLCFLKTAASWKQGGWKWWDWLHPNKPERELKRLEILPRRGIPPLQTSSIVQAHLLRPIPYMKSHVTRCNTWSSIPAKPKSLWWNPRLQIWMLLQRSWSSLLISSFSDLRCWILARNMFMLHIEMSPWPLTLTFRVGIGVSFVCVSYS